MQPGFENTYSIFTVGRAKSLDCRPERSASAVKDLAVLRQTARSFAEFTLSEVERAQDDKPSRPALYTSGTSAIVHRLHPATRMRCAVSSGKSKQKRTSRKEQGPRMFEGLAGSILAVS